MPRLAHALPRYRLHRASGQAVVTLGGRDHYLGPYAMYAPVDSGEKVAGKPKWVWRATQFLGVDRAAGSAEASAPLHGNEDPEHADVVVLDDAALGFRERRESWPRALFGDRPPAWIVLKISRPVAQGPLWDYQIEHHAERVVVVMTVRDLRRSEVQISRQISWERTAQDLFWELIRNPRVNGAARCAATVISFETAGAFLLRAKPSEDATRAGRWSAELFFDPNACEGGWEGDRTGKVVGNTVALTASLVRRLLLNPEQPDLHAGIQSGVAAQRRLFREGYGVVTPDGGQCQLSFPFPAVSDEILADTSPLAVAPIQDPEQLLHGREATTAPATKGLWTILEDRHRKSLDSIAERIVLDGLKSAITDVPIGRFGGLSTVDRREIEALHSIQNLLREYCDQSQKRPLSIAVFGPPGAGKSFGVEQVAKSVRPGMIETKTFNLSQFAHPEELLAALHQVRDVALQGKLPLVFWDEFDTSLHGAKLAWLRYFLAPMQDGSFQQGEVTHPIGKCIFVFAGGTDKYEEYLQVWDLREGFRDGVYERGNEKTFLEIAELTKRPVSTLNNQYCRAFELIVGFPYSRELWLQLYGPIKLTDVIEAGMARTRRPAVSPTPRDVPESVFAQSAEADREAGVVSGVQAGDDMGLPLLLNDISELIGRGRSDVEIGKEMDLEPAAIAYSRQRGDVSGLRP